MTIVDKLYHGAKSMAEMKSLYILCNALYHSVNAEATPLSDDEYDQLKREIQQLDPEWTPLKQAGWKISQDSPLAPGKHKGFMGSIMNAYDLAPAGAEEEFKWHRGVWSWMQKIPNPYAEVVSTHKIDGLSVALEYEAGQLQHALTRGDCITGETVTQHISLMKNVPTFIPYGGHVVIRGEVVMLKDQWEKFKILHPEAKNPRNSTAGIMGRKEPDEARFLNFFAHGVTFLDFDGARPDTYHSLLGWFNQQGFYSSPNVCSAKMEDHQQFHAITMAKRDELKYEVDGIVLIVNSIHTFNQMGVDNSRCPRGAVAWKFPAAKAVTTFRELEISVGHSGKLTPTAIVDPVEVGGVTISRASLSNWDLIKKLGLKHGDQVEIERCGDVIPGVVRVSANAIDGLPIVEPVDCPVCNGEVGRRQLRGKGAGVSADTFCLNPDCPAKSTGKIKKWVKDTGMLDVGDSTIEAMVEHKLIEDIADLYLLDENQLQSMPFGKSSFGWPRAKKVLKSIQGKTVIPLNTYLGALGIQGLGEGIARKVRELAPGEFDKLTDWFEEGKLIRFANQVSLPNVAESIAKGLQERFDLVMKLTGAGVIAQDPPKAETKSTNSKQMNICLTGSMSKPRKEIEAAIRVAGHGVADDVNANTTHLVQADPSSASSKSKKAAKLGIPVISEGALYDLLKAQPEAVAS